MSTSDTAADTTTVPANSQQGRSRGLNILVWTLQVLIAAAFLAAGSFKLIGNPMMVEIFDHVGVGQWSRIVTGTVEVVGALLLLASR